MRLLTSRIGALSDFVLTVACIFGISLTLVFFYFLFSHSSHESTLVSGTINSNILLSGSLHRFIEIEVQPGMNVADVIALASSKNSPDFIKTKLETVKDELPSGVYSVQSTNGLNHRLLISPLKSMRLEPGATGGLGYQTTNQVTETIPGLILSDVITLFLFNETFTAPSGAP